MWSSPLCRVSGDPTPPGHILSVPGQEVEAPKRSQSLRLPKPVHSGCWSQAQRNMREVGSGWASDIKHKFELEN